MEEKQVLELHTAQLTQVAGGLRAGQRVLLSGTVYTARDAAHARMAKAMAEGSEMPFPLQGACIYYAGPTPAPQGLPIGSCGPTTSGRMDPYTPGLMEAGVLCTIGKGARSPQVAEAIRRRGGMYLCALGGAGALAASCIRASRVIAYEDLGCESVKELQVERFPLIVAMDCAGGNLFERGAH